MDNQMKNAANLLLKRAYKTLYRLQTFELNKGFLLIRVFLFGMIFPVCQIAISYSPAL